MSSYHNCLSQIQFDLNSTPIFFDVGCDINPIPTHCGVLDDFTEIALLQYPNSKCYGFDPLNWQSYEQKWGKDPRITIIKKALSDSSKNQNLFVPGTTSPDGVSHAISSFYKRDCFSSYIDAGYGISEIEVECTTIDIFCNEFGLDKIDYLKIDTEGSELNILKGAKKYLENKKINVIQTEYGGTFDDAGYTVSDLVYYLKQFNYTQIFKTESELLFVHEENIL
jgi:FkbM family methyltransferase